MQNPISDNDLSRAPRLPSRYRFLNFVRTAAALLAVSGLTMSCKVRTNSSESASVQSNLEPGAKVELSSHSPLSVDSAYNIRGLGLLESVNLKFSRPVKGFDIGDVTIYFPDGTEGPSLKTMATVLVIWLLFCFGAPKSLGASKSSRA